MVRDIWYVAVPENFDRKDGTWRVECIYQDWRSDRIADEVARDFGFMSVDKVRGLQEGEARIYADEINRRIRASFVQTSNTTAFLI